MKWHFSFMVVPLTAILATASYWSPGNGTTAASDEASAESAPSVPQEPVELDGGSSDALRVSVSDRIPPGGRFAVVFVRDADIYTCNDLGRELRRLARWAALDSLPLLIATDSAGAARLSTYLSREKVPAEVIVVAERRMLRGAPPLTTPSLLLVSATGTARGFARRDVRSAIDFVSWAETLQKPPLPATARPRPIQR